jgi:hypothetical protein
MSYNEAEQSEPRGMEGWRMLYREIVDEARRLSLREQLLLVEELLRGIRQSEDAGSRRKRRRVQPMSELRGALKPVGELPTDGELQDIYAGHLLEKYL